MLIKLLGLIKEGIEAVYGNIYSIKYSINDSYLILDCGTKQNFIETEAILCGENYGVDFRVSYWEKQNIFSVDGIDCKFDDLKDMVIESINTQLREIDEN